MSFTKGEEEITLLYVSSVLGKWIIGKPCSLLENQTSTRAICCEVDASKQPLVTTSPPGDAHLPVEYSVLDRNDIVGDEASSITRNTVLVSSLTSTREIGGFACAAQATHLLDQVIRALALPDPDNRLLLLQGLDDAIQSFLTLILSQCQGRTGVNCAAIAIVIR